MDYEHFIANLFLASIIIIGVLMVVLVIVIAKLWKKRTGEEALKAQKVSELFRGQIEESERTLAEVSRKIHNTVWQDACMMGLALERTRSLLEREGLGESIRQAIETNSKMIRDIERICHTLNYDFLGVTGLANTLEQELEYHAQSEDILYSVTQEGEADGLTPETRLVVFRILQEVILNIIRHAQASVIDIRLQSTAKDFRIRVNDNGVGFSADRLHSIQGTGLKIMRSRAALINAVLDIRSLPGNGTTTELTIPLS